MGSTGKPTATVWREFQEIAMRSDRRQRLAIEFMMGPPGERGLHVDGNLDWRRQNRKLNYHYYTHELREHVTAM